MSPDHLFKWIKTFPLKGPHSTLNDLCDGVALAKVCQDICPSIFTEDLVSKIKENVSSENWILRVSNIKKVLEGLSDVYESILGYSMISTASSFPKPDALLIGKECNPSEMAKLLQLILGAAVNCDNKEWYIANIMKLDTDTQIAVKNAIESLFISIGESTVSSGRGRSTTADSIISLPFSDAINSAGDATLPEIGAADASTLHQLKLEIARLNHDLSAAIECKEKATQELFDLKRELKTIKEENNQLNSDNEMLSCKLQKKSSQGSSSVVSQHDNSANSLSEPSDASLKEAHAAKLQNQIDRLKEDLFKMENSREEVRIKNELLEKELLDLKFKSEELQRRANEARNLKDELDIHKQLSEKAEKYEATIEVYKKKLEEAAELKRKFRMDAGDKNVTESQLKVSLEDEMRRNSSLKATNENLKKRIQELTTSLATITHRADSGDFELNMLKQKLGTMSEKKEQLDKELEEAKRTISRLEAGQSTSNRHKMVLDDELDHENGNRNALSFELGTSESESKIVTLETENRELKNQIDTLKKKLSNGPPAPPEGTSGHSSFRMTNGRDNEVITRPANSQNLSSDPADVHKLIESLSNEVYHWKEKVSQLEGALFKKKEEIAEMDLRYKRCVNKAKQVAKVLEPMRPTSSNSSITSMANFEQLTLDLSAKEKTIQELEAENAKINQIKEIEQRLMTSAFHKMAFQLQKTSADERITGKTLTSSVNNANSSSFLNRQRQAPPPRRLNQQHR